MSLDDAQRRAQNRTYVRACVCWEPNGVPNNFRQATARASASGRTSVHRRTVAIGGIADAGSIADLGRARIAGPVGSTLQS